MGRTWDASLPVTACRAPFGQVVMVDLPFACNRASGLFTSSSPRAPTRRRGLVEGSSRLVIILSQAFSQKK
jgi:hypothetical protein